MFSEAKHTVFCYLFLCFCIIVWFVDCFRAAFLKAYSWKCFKGINFTLQANEVDQLSREMREWQLKVALEIEENSKLTKQLESVRTELEAVSEKEVAAKRVSILQSTWILWVLNWWFWTLFVLENLGVLWQFLSDEFHKIKCQPSTDLCFSLFQFLWIGLLANFLCFFIHLLLCNLKMSVLFVWRCQSLLRFELFLMSHCI